MLAIIGGSGLGNIEGLEIIRREIVRTPYGQPSEPLIFGNLGGKEVIFLARHGANHTLAPHNINYRANIWALQSVGVKSIISIASVGSIEKSIKVGDFVIPHQIIDYTYGRNNTFFDGLENPVKHIDFTYPYDMSLREIIIQSVQKLKYNFVSEGVYAATQGPRLETAAEIDRYEKDGATIVGMTAMPEAVLARELNLSYIAICPVANHAAGRGESAEGITSAMLSHSSEQTIKNTIDILIHLVKTHGY
ncbi:MAG: S-methyl-5'-thioinosine phosphorylase [Betaproteobacteria bacterium]|nr:S-methyl-5'-thioinosine phosphorylase [Betaproteobacteria bacterium]